MITDRKYVSGTTNAGLRLSDGSIIRGYNWEMNAQKGDYIPDGEGTMILVSGLYRSTDEGKTWVRGGDIVVENKKDDDSLDHATSGAAEPAYVELKDGSLYSLVRTGTHHLWEARSYDKGISWTKSQQSPLVSHNCPAALLSLDDESVMVVYNDHPTKRARLCTRVSYDGCKTWSEPKVFAPAGFFEENIANYPVACRIDDELILIVWGQKHDYNKEDNQQIMYARINKKWLEQ